MMKRESAEIISRNKGAEDHLKGSSGTKTSTI